MAKRPPRKVAFVSSFFPKRCGIATFTSDLIKNVGAVGGSRFEPLVVAMQSDGGCQYNDPVKFEIRKNVKNDYISAADYVNFSHVDLVSVQHEFGLFGGEAGAYLNLLLQRVNAPIITTLHTVLADPDSHYFQSMRDVCQVSHKVVVMNERGIDMLKDIYGVPAKKIELIPHGIPDLPFVDSSYYKHEFGMDGRKTILTFGLLGRSKGIEVMLKALPRIVAADPTVLYIILGATHPEVIRHQGEEYRFGLKRLVQELNLGENVIFHDRFVNDKELHNFLCAADIYVTPYQNKEQLTSGTLAFAVGAGKAVVSTPYWAAEELLDDNRGRLVPFANPDKLADTVVDIIKDDELFYSLRRKAYDYGRSRTWPMTGKTYWDMFDAKHLPVRMPVKTAPSIEEPTSLIEIPEPPLTHLQRLTDDTGLYQHAKFITPNKEHGYCTDDNARAVVAMVKYYAQYSEPEALRLFDIYLSFLYYSQNPDGTIKNLMAYERNWIEDEPVHDALGRTLWAFGAVMAKPPRPKYVPIVKDYFDRSVCHVPELSLRGKAYSIFGLADYLQQFPGASDIKRYLSAAADDLVLQYKSCSGDKWSWFEDELTYDNAVFPCALFVAGMVMKNKEYLEIAEKSCEFVIENTIDGNSFSLVGCNGWYKKGKKRAKFDQQPIDAASTVMMLGQAYLATNNPSYLKLQRKAFDWFLGENDLGIAVYDFQTKGCNDGLEENGVNINQGAESMVSFLLSLLCIVESYSISRKVKEPIDLTRQEAQSHIKRMGSIIRGISKTSQTEHIPSDSLE